MISSIRKKEKPVSCSFLILFLINFLSNPVFGRPGGPSQPESTSFTPINNKEMVNTFSGKFSYNIPIMDVGGYPLNIVYDASVNNEQDVSWVGMGWSLNPGSINRLKRGLPDDFKGDLVTKDITRSPIVKIGGGLGVSAQIANFFDLTLKTGVFYHNKIGWGTEATFSPGLKYGVGIGDKTSIGIGGGVTIASSSTEGVTSSFNGRASISSMISNIKNNVTLGLGYGESSNSRMGLLEKSWKINFTTVVDFNIKKLKQSQIAKNQIKSQDPYTIHVPSNLEVSFNHSYIDPTYLPTPDVGYEISTISFDLKGGGDVFTCDMGAMANGYKTEQIIKQKQIKNTAFGYLYEEKSKNMMDALMDINREKDIAYHPNVPNIAIPNHTFDLFSLNQHDNGGQFRAIRNNVGILKDPLVQTTQNSTSVSLEAHFGAIVELGGTIVNVDASSDNFLTREPLLSNFDFKDKNENNNTQEQFYFKKSDEVESGDNSYYNLILKDKAANIMLSDLGDRLNIVSNKDKDKSLINNNLYPFYNKVYDQNQGTYLRPNYRNTLIYFLDNNSRKKYGIEKNIFSYSIDNNTPLYSRTNSGYVNYDKFAHHISEFNCINPDGNRYVYGIPVYNIKENNIYFSVAPTAKYNSTNGLVEYTSNEMSTSNSSGLDNEYSNETISEYAHSWLLTSVLSPDYVDVLDDGITDDDRGSAIKFNYFNNGIYSWRNPIHPSLNTNYALMNKGVEYLDDDNRAILNYGEKEDWYVQSIESKTSIAIFYFSDRLDARPVNIHGILDPNKKNKQKLDSIKLFSKADIQNYLKNNPNCNKSVLFSNVVPIKTCIFQTSYRLSPNTPNSLGGGKLTLDAISFQYGTSKKRISYSFNYGNTAAENPDFNAKHSDRWGNFKPQSDNLLMQPNGLIDNDKFPYVIQDETLANKNANVWLLKKITLPSGGTISIEYEANTYSLIQNKRVAQMYKLVGVSDHEGTDFLNNNKLFDVGGKLSNYFYIETNIKKTPNSSLTRNDILNMFLKDPNDFQEKMYLAYRFRTKLDPNSNKLESLPGYIEVEDYGVATIPSSNGNYVFWVKIPSRSVDGVQVNNVLLTSWQFIKDNIPALAWDGFTLGHSASILDVLGSIASNIGKIITGESKFEKQAVERALAQSISLNGESWVRAYIPSNTKYGGGSRVKRISVSDNWSDLVSKNNGVSTTDLKNNVYTVDYEYTKVDKDGKTVSSGVAPYEPMIGADENPWKQPVYYEGQIGPGGPASLYSLEKPFGESFFPNAEIGYSKVKVTTNKDKSIQYNTGNGFKVFEYYTCADEPVKVENTELNSESVKREKSEFNISHILIPPKNTWDLMSVSQGYSVVLNDMHGKMKSEKFYKYGQKEIDAPFSYTDYIYKKTTTLPVMDENGATSNADLGLKVEFMVDARENKTRTATKDYNPGGGLIPTGLPPFMPWAMFFDGYSTDVKQMRMIATNKVIQRSYMLEKVVKNIDGAITTAENLIWDKNTGSVILSQSNDEFKNVFYNLNLPAYFVNKKMGPAYKNINIEMTMPVSNSASGDLVMKSNGELLNSKNYLSNGDEVYIEDLRANPSNSYSGKYHFTEVNSNNSIIAFFVNYMGKALIPSNDVSLFKVKVIRSINRNLQSLSAMQVSSLNPPVIGAGIVSQLNGVLSASAIEYSDDWKWICKTPNLKNMAGGCLTEFNKNPFVYGIKGNWRPMRSPHVNTLRNYTYSSNLSKTNIAYDGLSYAIPAYYNSSSLWGKSSSNLWNSISQNTLFDSKGNLVEEMARFSKLDNQDYVGLPDKVFFKFHTAINALGDGILSGGATDLNWTCSPANLSNYNPAIVVANSYSTDVWCKSIWNNAGWISTNSSSGIRVPPDDWNFKNTIDIPVNTNLTNFELVLNFYVDNNIKEVTLNGIPVSISSSFVVPGVGIGSFACEYMVRAVLTGFKVGKNELVVKVHDNGSLIGLICQLDAKYSNVNCKEDSVFSATKYGYMRSAPVITAANAKHQEIEFTSFEEEGFNLSSNLSAGAESQFDSELSSFVNLGTSTMVPHIDNNLAHTGKNCLAVPLNYTTSLSINNCSLSDVKSISKDAQHNINIAKGLSVPQFKLSEGKKYRLCFWVKSVNSTSNDVAKIDFVGSGSPTKVISIVPNSKTIEGWQKVEAVFDVPASYSQFVLTLMGNGSPLSLRFFDDIKIIPAEAEAKCFVYDNTSLKLLSELDENHFATFYDYNEAGDLIRVRKETDRGIITIKETNFNYQK